MWWPPNIVNTNTKRRFSIATRRTTLHKKRQKNSLKTSQHLVGIRDRRRLKQASEKFNFSSYQFLKANYFSNILHLVARRSDSVQNRKYGGVGIKSSDVCISTYNFGSKVFGTMIYENLQVSVGSSINDVNFFTKKY